MYRNHSILDFDQATMGVQFHGSTEYAQESILGLPIEAYHDQAHYDGWILAAQSTLSLSEIAHYYDCKIDYANEPEYHHFPCNDPRGCDYCDLVRQALADHADIGDLVSFARFEERFPLSSNDDQTEYYRETLPSYFTGLDLRYWRSYWQDPIEDDDYEDEDDDYSEDAEESHAYNQYGYSMADHVEPQHFDGVANGWIAPNGTFYYVPDYRNHGCGHWETAKALGFGSAYDPVNGAEQAGYIHLSSYWSYTHRFHYVPNRPTREQKEIAQLYCAANGIPLPESLAPDDEPILPDDEPFTVKTFTFWNRVEDSTLPRKVRDLFYPLSGD